MTVTDRPHRATERLAMLTFAHASGISFEIQQSHFMPGTVCFVVGEGKARKILHSPANAWKALRRLALPRPPASRRPPAQLRGAVMGIKLVD